MSGNQVGNSSTVLSVGDRRGSEEDSILSGTCVSHFKIRLLNEPLRLKVQHSSPSLLLVIRIVDGHVVPLSLNVTSIG